MITTAFAHRVLWRWLRRPPEAPRPPGGVCDSYLRDLVRREQERKWRENHADFIAAYNATVEAEGLPLEAWRNF